MRWSTSIDGPSRTWENGEPVYHCVDISGYKLPPSMRLGSPKPEPAPIVDAPEIERSA